ncbi:MAG: 30S ribosomal protein S3 [Chloroflexi bacterium RBG_16_63_12]|jgi:small subunit ribosomal protein S3|nr:ribosomal protein [Anaerolineales bacterium]OGO45018.1 MAG: 30S ribosomal protein S3 [Chloroflexi bacterium RBG_16_63_12]
MGRKVHPIGFRLGLIKDWEARWFAPKGKYAALLQQDFAIRRLIEGEAPGAAVARIDIDRSPSTQTVTIWTAKPGILIGRKGAQVKVLRQKLEELTGSKVKVEVEEITQPDLTAKLVAANIADQLERRINHSRAMKRAIGQAMRQGAQGIKIVCAGRLGGSEMSRREWQREGRVPLQTLRADIDFARAEALTTFGRIGVKVWIYKGEKMPETVEVPEVTDVYVSE